MPTNGVNLKNNKTKDECVFCNCMFNSEQGETVCPDCLEDEGVSTEERILRLGECEGLPLYESEASMLALQDIFYIIGRMNHFSIDE